jgi:divalent anion:Na+ symporter, DASS family
LTADAARDERRTLGRWLLVLLIGALTFAAPVPAGVTTRSWALLAVFLATVAGLVAHPMPGGAVVFLAIAVIALTGILPVKEALAGYADPVVWLVLAAFFMSRGILKTGLGRRIAFLFIRAIGGRSLGLGYALAATDFVLASFIPSNGARCGGIVFPITLSVARAYSSEPGPTAARLGTFLMALVYQCEVVVCATFLTGQASNPLIAKFAGATAHVDLTYGRWLLAAIVPGLVSLALVPRLVYRMLRPEITHTPAATAMAREELARMGPLGRPEKTMLAVFALVASLWMTQDIHGIHYAAVALLGAAVLLLTGVLDWEDVLGERNAWEVYFWYGGLVGMAEALGTTGIARHVAETASGLAAGWPWWGTLSALLFVYFFVHYAFASITAHVSAMYVPFLAVSLAAGVPVWLAVLSFASFSNLAASLTHYGTTPGPIYFGAGYVTQRAWWRVGFVAALVNIAVWTTVGFAWWKLLGWW